MKQSLVLIWHLKMEVCHWMGSHFHGWIDYNLGASSSIFNSFLACFRRSDSGAQRKERRAKKRRGEWGARKRNRQWGHTYSGFWG